MRRSIRAGQAGLVLSYGLTLSGSLYYVVFNLLMIEVGERKTHPLLRLTL